MIHPRAGSIVALFGTPFALAGLFLLWTGLWPYVQWYASTGWDYQPVTLTALELQELRGRKSTSYRVRCAYEYVVGARTYTGSRVSFESDQIRFSGGERDRFRELDVAWRKDRRWLARVEPGHPENIVLFHTPTRDGFAALASGSLFACIGLGLVGLGLGLIVQERGERLRARAYPDRPWRIAGFSSCEIPALGWGRLALGWVFCLAFIAFVGLVAVAVFDKRHAPWWVRALSGTFGLFGLAAFYAMILETARTCRYGGTRLVFAEMPIRPGLSFAGAVEATSRIAAPSVALALRCVRAVRRGRSIQRETVAELTASAPVSPDGRRVPFSIPVPPDLPPRGDGVHWELDATARTPGVDFVVQFTDLPVYPADPALVER